MSTKSFHMTEWNTEHNTKHIKRALLTLHDRQLNMIYLHVAAKNIYVPSFSGCTKIHNSNKISLVERKKGWNAVCCILMLAAPVWLQIHIHMGWVSTGDNHLQTQNQFLETKYIRCNIVWYVKIMEHLSTTVTQS